MEIEKRISFLIDQQFPAIYRENGPELVQLVVEYYKFLETVENQSNYVSRRLFDYKDIATTISKMLVFFQKKHMADLPFREDAVKLLVRNIIGLYRAKGTEAGIKAFFRAFYDEDVEIYYPAKQMLKPSHSKWRSGVYLQMRPNKNFFTSPSGKAYTYDDIIGTNIVGSLSRARAAVNKINFIVLKNRSVPIIYLNETRGIFQKYDEVIVTIGGEQVRFGMIEGSLSEFIVDEAAPRESNNKVGDIFSVESNEGIGGKAIVTEVSESFTGEINYEIRDGGFGYSKEYTKLVVSDQVLVLENTNFSFTIGELLRDSGGNEGFIVGQNENAVGVKMNPSNSFDISRVISTVDRDVNITLNVDLVTEKNDSSPGQMFADTGNLSDVRVDILENETQVSFIQDVIQDYLSVTINSANYNSPPASKPMSGGVDPVSLSTRIVDAFDLTPIMIGTISQFANIDPGENYRNDAFAYAIDDVFSKLKRRNQFITLQNIEETFLFNVGEIIEEEGTGIKAVIKAANTKEGYLAILPYSYYGFNGQNRFIRTNGDTYNVLKVDTDYESDVYGNNANIVPRTEFATGKIKKVAIYDSGFGYIDNSEGRLADDNGSIYASGVIESDTQGKTSGFWSDLSSHINGFVEKSDGELEYLESNMRIQDSDFYQEYSYLIKSMMGTEKYETLLKENVHLAGTKMFGQFSYKRKAGDGSKMRAIRLFNDQGIGTPLDRKDSEELTADVFTFTVDSDKVSVDNDSTV